MSDNELIVYDNVQEILLNHKIQTSFPTIFYKTLELFILQPLALLYIHGPHIGGFGFWGGKTNEEICSNLTNVESDFWKNNEQMCINLIYKKFNSFAICILIFFYFFLFYWLIKFILNIIPKLFKKLFK